MRNESLTSCGTGTGKSLNPVLPNVKEITDFAIGYQNYVRRLNKFYETNLTPDEIHQKLSGK